MAIYPKAKQRLIKKHNVGSRILNYRRVNLHVTASEAKSQYGWFSQSGFCSHFHVDKEGVVEQYIDTRFASKADLQGNQFTVSIETQGGARNADSEPWTAKQLAAIIELWAWIRDTHGIKNRIATGTDSIANSEGLSWHRLGIEGNFGNRKGLAALHYGGGAGLMYSRARGKVCPGDAKIHQIPSIFEAANTGSKPAPSKPAPAPSKPKAKTVSQMADEVIAGKHGNGHEQRRKSLGVSASVYQQVRAEVNRRAGIKTAAPKPKAKSKSINQMADEVIAGKHGNGHEQRRKSLGVNASVYGRVRAEVNRRM